MGKRLAVKKLMSASTSFSALAASTLLMCGATAAYAQTQPDTHNPFAAPSEYAPAKQTALADNKLKDIQVGEKGRLLRIAIICERECDLRQVAGDVFRLDGVTRALDIPLGDRSKLVRALKFEPDVTGSILSIDANGAISRASSNPCVVDDEAAWCIDLEFLDFASVEPVKSPSPSQAIEGETRIASAPSLKPQAVRHSVSSSGLALRDGSTGPSPVRKKLKTTEARPVLRQPKATGPGRRIVEAPGLRDATNSDVLAFARFSPLEPTKTVEPVLAAAAPQTLRTGRQLALREPSVSEIVSKPASNQLEIEVPAPQAAPRLAMVKPIEAEDAISSPNLPRLQQQPITSPPPFDFGVAAGVILGEAFDEARCTQARTQLSDDAWALDAMAAVGFCLASEGKLAEADQLFTRLLAYTPDNYHAWVGRALIAVDAGEKSAARRFFQEALNVPPPFIESERIITAIERL